MYFSPIISRRKAKLLFLSSLIMSRCIKSPFFSRKSYKTQQIKKITINALACKLKYIRTAYNLNMTNMTNKHINRVALIHSQSTVQRKEILILQQHCITVATQTSSFTCGLLHTFFISAVYTQFKLLHYMSSGLETCIKYLTLPA